jgi:hypothetical protein
MSLFKKLYYNFNISNGSIIASGNTNTLGNIFTTGGNVGINTTTPNSTLDISGTLIASGSTINNLFTTNLTSNNIVSSNINVTSGIFNTLSSILLSATTITGANLSLSGNLNVAGTLTTVNITSQNLVNTNVSAGTLFASSFFSASSNSNTLGNLFTTAGNIGINTTNPRSSLDISGNLIALGSTINNVLANNITSTNLLLNNLSTGSINASELTNLTNVIATNETLATLIVTTGLTTGTINATGLTTLTNISATNETLTNLIVTTGLTTGTINATGLTLTNISATNETLANLIITSGLSTGNINASGLTSLTNASVTNMSTTNLISTGLTSSNINVNNLSGLNANVTSISSGNINVISGLTTGTINATGLTTLTNVVSTNKSAGTLNLSTGLTTATAKITNADITNSTISNLYITTILQALGNSNTIGSLFTTGGNIGIGTTAPNSMLDINTDADAIIGMTINNTNTGGNARSNMNIGSGQIYTMSTGDNAFIFRSISQNSAGINLIAANTGANIRLSTANTERMRILGSGNVGINTISPNATLDVNGTVIITTSLTTGSVFATNVTTSNMVSTSITTGSINASGLSSLTNMTATNETLATLIVTSGLTTGTINATGLSTLTNISATNETLSSLIVTTGLTTGTMNATNTSITNVTTTNIINTAMTSSTLNLTTGLTTGTINATGITSGNINFTGNLYQNGAIYISSQWTNNSSDIYYTGGNVGINTITPAYTFDVNGSMRVTSSIITGSINSTNSTFTNILVSASSVSNLVVTNSTLNNLFVSNNTTTNLLSTNITSTTLNLTTGITTANAQITNLTVPGSSTLANLFVPGAFSAPNAYVTLYGLTASTDITTGAVYATNSTITNIVSSNMTSATLNLTIGLTTASAQIANANVTTSTIATLLSTNAVSTNMTSATLNLSSGLTTASAQITNANVTTSTIATLLNTNVVSSNMTSATLNLSTGLTAASAQITNANVTTSTIATLVSTNITSATLNLSTGLTAANAQITNENVTTSTIATLRVPTNLLAIGNSNTVGSIFTTGGNVGIGTTSPGEMLDVRGNLRVGGSTQANYIAFYGTHDDGPGLFNHSYIGERKYDDVESSELFLFKGNDASSGYGPDRIRLLASEHRFDIYTLLPIGSTFDSLGTTGTTSLIVATTGNVGIGTTTPSFTLDVVGSARFSVGVTTSGLEVTGLTDTLNLTATNITSSNIFATNLSLTNISTGTINVSGSSTLANLVVSGSSTLANLNVPGGFSAPNASVSVWGLTASTNITTSAVYATNSTITNIVSTNLSTGSVNSSGITTGNLNFTGSLYQNGAPYTSNSQWTTNLANIFYTTGNVGIGTTSPSFALDVVGSARFSVGITTGGLEVTGLTDTVNLTVTNMTSSTARITGVLQAINNSNTIGSIFTTGGNVGVNTAAPNTYLQIAGTASTYGHLFINDPNPTIWGGAVGGSGATLTLKAGYGAGGETDSQRSKFQINGWNSDANQANAFVFKTSGDTERMRIINSGNVGIGTSAPIAKLHVNGGDIGLTYGYGLTVPGQTYPDLMKVMWVGIDQVRLYTPGAYTGIPKLTLQGDGNVGVGTTSPSATLHVAGQAIVNNASVATPTLTTLGGTGTKIQIGDGSGSALPYAIGVETANMWFSSGSGFKWYGGDSTQSSMQLTSSNLVVTGDVVAFGSISDSRLKENIQNINIQIALDTVKTLRPVTFDWRQDIFNEEHRGRSDIGFIAQEVEDIIPEAVSEFNEINSGVTYKNMRYERMIPYLVGSIQRLEEILKNKSDMIDKQQIEIDNLKDVISLYLI